ADDGYQIISGTSFSAPNVTGSLNLIRQLYLQSHPNKTSMWASTLNRLLKKSEKSTFSVA
ncbi:MAG TPA: hypothetical protein EYO78_08985, partial [Gammaproteobacteria bacterium]|nr:hypothetical protein [Gammaproteobacteria bacterium]